MHPTEAGDLNDKIMDMKDIRKYLIIAAAVMCCACTEGGGNAPEPATADEITISGLEEGKWTYFSLSKGETIGTSTFLSEEEDALWAARTDWDFAICGDYIRTNGGTSGKGSGGMLRDTEHNFQTLREAPAEGYLQDGERTVKQ